MPGAIAIIVALFVLPVIVCMSFAAIAAVFGELLYRDGEARHESSELLDLNI